MCPNGHYSTPVKENEPLPRRCMICRQQYLRMTRPIWCDENGNELESREEDQEGKPDIRPENENINETPVRKRKKRSFFNEIMENTQPEINKTPEDVEEAPEKKLSSAKVVLQTGTLSITLEGEGILGRETTGAEILAVNRLVSRRHCYFIVTEQKGLEIRDAGSMNGTFADTGNGRFAVDGETGIHLKTGDRIWLADMLFEVKEE